ncbi:MAG: sel1 repeat family protein, partial [Candidatus Methanomethylophilaceae archaeon]|nr:sel1 repeat family protein [Candidatus Methanomethylophilaceae archaeon]
MRDPIFRAAEMGDPYACLGVAYYYHEGKEVEPDMGLAVEWYRRAASGGCPRAHWELAKLYSEGIL